jgi:hypothetical protein
VAESIATPVNPKPINSQLARNFLPLIFLFCVPVVGRLLFLADTGCLTPQKEKLLISMHSKANANDYELKQLLRLT